MKRTIILVLLLTASAVAADDLVCNGCVHTDDIRNQAITTRKIKRHAATEGKLAPEVQRKLNGLVVTDGVGRKLPIVLSSIMADSARGYFRWEDGAIIPISIARPVAGHRYQIYGERMGSYGVTRSISFTGAGCTGQPFIRDYGNGSFLFPYSLITDPETPNRARLIYRIGDELAAPLGALSYMGDGVGCVDIDSGQAGGPLDGYEGGGILDGYLSPGRGPGPSSSLDPSEGPVVGPAIAYFAITFEGSIRWVPPLTIHEVSP